MLRNVWHLTDRAALELVREKRHREASFGFTNASLNAFSLIADLSGFPFHSNPVPFFSLVLLIGMFNFFFFSKYSSYFLKMGDLITKPEHLATKQSKKKGSLVQNEDFFGLGGTAMSANAERNF